MTLGESEIEANIAALTRYGTEHGWWGSGRATRYFFERQLYRDVDLNGKDMLDIGCGRGVHTLWAKAKGASHITAVEPAGDGSRSSTVLDTLREAKETLGFSGIEISESTFQDFEAGDRSYDVALMSASVNHLDEEACVVLHADEKARETFREIFRRLHSLMNPGGVVIITDVSNRNFFGDLGLRNPFSPTIEWHKHQPPSVWAGLLREAGFAEPRVYWMSPSQYFAAGLVFRNAFCNYLRSSLFRIVVRA